jgi:hypothetical protein
MRRFVAYAAVLVSLLALAMAGTASFPWNLVPPLPV